MRLKPFVSSHAVRIADFTTLPGAAENVSAAIFARGRTRWLTAFAVVDRMRGRSSDVSERARRARTVMRCAVMAPVGETRS